MKSESVEVKVLCDICQAKHATHSCKLCGKRVCSDHFDAKRGVCTDHVTTAHKA